MEVGQRIIIIAPHPDDETLACGGLIQRAVREGKEVRIVFITCGDGYKGAIRGKSILARVKPDDYQRLGQTRYLEAVAATGILGVREEQLYFLGYPDGGLKALWLKNWSNNLPLQAVNGSSFSPYAFGYRYKALYSGESLSTDLKVIISEFLPTDIIFPHSADAHVDHWATHVFVQYILEQLNYGGQQWTFLLHRGNKLNLTHASWYSLPLKESERIKKLEAVRKHQTQWQAAQAFLSKCLGDYENFERL